MASREKLSSGRRANDLCCIEVSSRNVRVVLADYHGFAQDQNSRRGLKIAGIAGLTG